MISDRPESDGGGNFGRLARAGVMEDYIAELFEEKLAGIQLLAWQRFLSVFTENVSSNEIDKAIERTARNSASSVPDVKTASELVKKFREIAALIEELYLSRNKRPDTKARAFRSPSIKSAIAWEGIWHQEGSTKSS